MDDISAGSKLSRGIDLMSHEVRADILSALLHYHREESATESVRFSELRERVGHEDPGNFNYHLDRLRGNLVEQTDSGYRLSDIGHQLVALFVSGRFDPNVTREFPAIEPPCLLCGTPSTVVYEDGVFLVTCGDGHEARLASGLGGLDSRSVRVALNSALRRNLLQAKSFGDGICPYCEGEASVEVSRITDDPLSVQYEGHCRRCGMAVQNIPRGCVLFHPAVVSFCHRRGIDVYNSAWEVMAMHVETMTVHERDPLRIAVGLSVDGDTLELTLDDAGDVVSTSITQEPL